MINNINRSTILFFAAGIVAVVFYFYFKKKQPLFKLKNHNGMVLSAFAALRLILQNQYQIQ